MDFEKEKYFIALTKDRADSAQTLAKPSMRGVKTSVVEKYSDQAHFIYELLQNADDACAECARFILEQDRLIFVHNGTRRFSVSDPDTEDQDSQNGNLGDINAITSIANSNKNEDINKIGKFGVGFKAVFQYTETPLIYDAIFRFKIENFIVPVALNEDFPNRQANETVFVFPFNHPSRKPDAAFSDISEKLKDLKFPLLFLSRIKKIDFKILGSENVFGRYKKEIGTMFDFEDTKAQFISLSQFVEPIQQNQPDQMKTQINQKNRNGRKKKKRRSQKNQTESLENKTSEKNTNTKTNKLWLFSRTDKSAQTYSVGFFVDENKKLCVAKECAFCFFPTKVDTALNFIIHAPFLLTDSREGIRSNEDHNKNMINLLASLAADSFVYLRDIGLKQKNPLIDDNIISIVPFDSNDFDSDSKRMFKPFYEKIKEKFQTEELLPASCGYAKKKNAYWASVPKLAELFSDEQLAEISENQNARWVFKSFGRDETSRNNKNNKSLANYIDDLVKMHLDESDIIDVSDYGRFRTEKITGITESFIEKQSFSWLHKFYGWIAESKQRTEKIKTKAIFLDQNKKAVAAYGNGGRNILFFPTENIEDYTTVHPELLKNEETYEFLKNIGVKKPDRKDYIYNILFPKYNEHKDLADGDFKCLFEYYRTCENSEVDNYIQSIKNKKLMFHCESVNGAYWSALTVPVYILEKSLLEFFETKPDTLFLDSDIYKKTVGAVDKEKEKHLHDFFLKLGAKENIGILNVNVEPYSRKDLPSPYSTRERCYTENIIDGLKELIEYTARTKSKEKSILIWNTLLSIGHNYSFSYLLSGKCRYFYYSASFKTFESSDAVLLKTAEWLLNKSGDFVSSSELTRLSLSDVYDVSSDVANNLLDFLNIHKPKEDILKTELETRYGLKDDDIKNLDEIIQLYGRIPSVKELENQIVEKESQNNNTVSSEQIQDFSGFPSANVKNWSSLKKHAAQELLWANPVTYEHVWRSVRTSKNYSDARSYLQNMYGSYNSNKCACQMCHNPSSNITASQIENKPGFELDAIHLCLCPNCAHEYKIKRNNKNLTDDFLRKIRGLSDDEIKRNETVKIDFGGKSIWFTQTHVAEIRELLILQSQK